MTQISDMILHENAFLNTDNDTKKWRKSLVVVITISPASFAWILLSDAITLLGQYDCFFKHLVDDIVILGSYDGCALYESKNYVKRTYFFVVH